MLSPKAIELLKTYPGVMQAEFIQTRKNAYLIVENECNRFLQSAKMVGYQKIPFLAELLASGKEVFRYCQEHKNDVNMQAHDYERMKNVLEIVRNGLDST